MSDSDLGTPQALTVGVCQGITILDTAIARAVP